MRPLRSTSLLLLVVLAVTAATAPEAAPDVDDLRLENFAVSADDSATADFENRRHRHTADALGRLVAALPRLRVARERRLDLPAAAIELDADGRPIRVTYPFERDFPAGPGGPRTASTHRSVDLLVGPLFGYELGRLYDPSLVSLTVEPRLVLNPWPGARLRASLRIPVTNDFGFDFVHPDADELRPGPSGLEQFGWIRGVGLASITGGIFDDNRYGFSFGVARPIAQGTVLFDAQADYSGFLAFEPDGISYSRPGLWTGFAGVTVHPPGLDVAVRMRVAQFVYNDRGVEFEIQRPFGDLDVALFTTFAEDIRITGLRLGIPVPPLTRPTRAPVRVLPVASFDIDYRDEAAPLGVFMGGVASRERYLEDLALSTLQANEPRRAAAFEGRPAPRPRRSGHPASFVGTTGFIVTPSATVIGQRNIEVGYGNLSQGASWDGRDAFPNEVWYATIGFLPRVELGLRWTVIPGLRPFEDLAPDSRYTDADRMSSARLQLLRSRGWIPDVSIGIEDAFGTRRFHSTYAVAGWSGDIRPLRWSLSTGYAPRAFDATRHTLDGAFGAAEVSISSLASVAIEHDSERWNFGVGLTPWGVIRLRAAWLDLEQPALGLGLVWGF
ncbi:MAG: hypothetical protein HOP12_09630 [Candidatus Eisenbacteria bacterium]|uniref:YjbH domain-containing protein n=1 Tax=Eiseniibacteriota bacterium TaxID=2212470 RepID=A0A849SII0_UNCEI|nr:hypothetical protein [Candidatus Eisenbacteria bacterium]